MGIPAVVCFALVFLYFCSLNTMNEFSAGLDSRFHSIHAQRCRKSRYSDGDREFEMWPDPFHASDHLGLAYLSFVQHVKSMFLHLLRESSPSSPTTMHSRCNHRICITSLFSSSPMQAILGLIPEWWVLYLQQHLMTQLRSFPHGYARQIWKKFTRVVSGAARMPADTTICILMRFPGPDDADGMTVRSRKKLLFCTL